MGKEKWGFHDVKHGARAMRPVVDPMLENAFIFGQINKPEDIGALSGRGGWCGQEKALLCSALLPEFEGLGVNATFRMLKKAVIGPRFPVRNQVNSFHGLGFLTLT
jgi:hypothetical protein